MTEREVLWTAGVEAGLTVCSQTSFLFFVCVMQTQLLGYNPKCILQGLEITDIGQNLGLTP